MLSEFDLISRYFASAPTSERTPLAVGDDGAILRPFAGEDIVVSADTLVENVHFFSEAPAAAVGVKCAAVNLSDLAAMAATPRWATLCLTLPKVDEPWIAGFAEGLLSTLRAHGCVLVGGDTTRGACLTLSLQVIGSVPKGGACCRHGAQVGDLVCVSGALGGAAAVLRTLKSNRVLRYLDSVEQAPLLRPRPRTDLVSLLRSGAHAAIDLSDGLAQDLGHIAAKSDVAIHLNAQALPRHALAQGFSVAQLLAAAEDYVLAFTWPEGLRAQLPSSIHVIGHVEAGRGVWVADAGQTTRCDVAGYQHF